MKRWTNILVVLASITLVACGGNNDNNENNANNANNENNENNENNTSNQPNNTQNNTSNQPNNTQNNTQNNTMNNTMGPTPTCDAYCDVVMANCTGENVQYGSRDECIDYCENVAGWEPGEAGAVDGNSIGCRIYHGGDPASTDPATHCPHAGPSGGGVCGSWCDNYCELMGNNCSDVYADDAECQTACGGFNDTGNAGDVEYDTVQCRIYHAGAPAATDAATHCPHAQEVPTEICLGLPTDFNFVTNVPGDYTRRDRIGMPAVSTALIASKDDYNDDGPTDDVAQTYVGEIVASLTALVGTAGTPGILRDDLEGAALTPCTTADLNGDSLPDCAGQEVAAGGPTVVSLVVPDTISIDPTQPAGFPNGRRLADPVMDVTLAIILLDMTVHTPTTLAELPLNPPENDLGVEGAFLTTFPYLHPPHTP